MKKLSVLLLFVGIAALISCNSGDDPKPNEIVIDDASLELIDGFTDDWGTSCWGAARDEGCTVTHSVPGVMITDGSFFDVEDCWPDGSNVDVNMGLYSPGEDGLTAGTYSILNSEPSGDQSENSFGWLYAEWYDGESYYYSSGATGTVKISGSYPNLTFKFDVEFTPVNNTRQEVTSTVSVSGQFNGTFEDHYICD